MLTQGSTGSWGQVTCRESCGMGQQGPRPWGNRDKASVVEGGEKGGADLRSETTCLFHPKAETGFYSASPEAQNSVNVN